MPEIIVQPETRDAEARNAPIDEPSFNPRFSEALGT
jgi:hypothetical protein